MRTPQQHTTAQHKEKRKAGSNINGSRRRQTCEKSTGENQLESEKHWRKAREKKRKALEKS